MSELGNSMGKWSFFDQANADLIHELGGNEYVDLADMIIKDQGSIRPMKFVAPQTQVSDIVTLGKDVGALEVVRAMYHKGLTGLQISETYEKALHGIMGTEEGARNAANSGSEENKRLALDYAICIELLGANLEDLMAEDWDRSQLAIALPNYLEGGIKTIPGERTILSVKYDVDISGETE